MLAVVTVSERHHDGQIIMWVQEDKAWLVGRGTERAGVACMLAFSCKT